MAKLTINGVEVEAEAGRRLVEVIKEQGIAITNLCYIDGLDPYAVGPAYNPNVLLDNVSPIWTTTPPRRDLSTCTRGTTCLALCRSSASRIEEICASSSSRAVVMVGRRMPQ